MPFLMEKTIIVFASGHQEPRTIGFALILRQLTNMKQMTCVDLHLPPTAIEHSLCLFVTHVM